MLTMTKARGWVDNSAFFARGRAYAQEGRVELLGMMRGPNGFVHCEAEVHGSSLYDVSVDFDEDELLDCGCDCPAYARTGEMCKHVAAVLIALCDRQKPERTQSGMARRM